MTGCDIGRLREPPRPLTFGVATAALIERETREGSEALQVIEEAGLVRPGAPESGPQALGVSPLAEATEAVLASMRAAPLRGGERR